MVTYIEDKINVDTYMYLRSQVNWKELQIKQAQAAIDGSIKIIVAYENDMPIGMGRVVGDGAVVSYIQDLIVIPEYQTKHVGSGLLERLTAFVDGITDEGTEMMLCLMCAKGREKFYNHHNFIARPTESLGPGMIQYINKK